MAVRCIEVVIDGPPGVGKSTVMEYLSKLVTRKYDTTHSVVVNNKYADLKGQESIFSKENLIPLRYDKLCQGNHSLTLSSIYACYLEEEVRFQRNYDMSHGPYIHIKERDSQGVLSIFPITTSLDIYPNCPVRIADQCHFVKMHASTIQEVKKLVKRPDIIVYLQNKDLCQVRKNILRRGRPCEVNACGLAFCQMMIDAYEAFYVGAKNDISGYILPYTSIYQNIPKKIFNMEAYFNRSEDCAKAILRVVDELVVTKSFVKDELL